jgi:protein-S-isoprenylcysteine O-methyltransferase Ste14
VEARSYARLAGSIFALIALLQLVRALSGWDITLNNTSVPVWASWVACAIALVLAWLGFSASRTRPHA